jgi:hypothetical protein
VSARVGSKIQDSIEKRRTQSPSSLATANRVEREEDRDRPAVTAALEQAYSCISVGRLGHGQIELCEDLGQIELCEDLGLSHSGLAHSWRHAQSDHVYHFSVPSNQGWTLEAVSALDRTNGNKWLAAGLIKATQVGRFVTTTKTNNESVLAT